MSREGLWIEDPTTGQPVHVYYDELEEETRQQLIKPIGGFCWRAGEFVQVRMPSVPFYVKDWLPQQGKAMIYAPPKSGKSYLAVQLARCVGSGEDFLGIPTTSGVVLYTQSEFGAGVLQDRLLSTKKSYDNVYVGTNFSMKLDTEGGQRQLNKALEAIEPNVLIIDPLYKAMSGDSNSEKDTMIVLDYLDSIIEAFNCSILIIHHPGKDIKRGGRGSSVQEDWVDSYIEMKRTSKQGEPLGVRLTPKLLRHAELPPEPIEVEMRDFEFMNVEVAVSIKQEVAEFIRKRWAVAGDSVSPAQLFAAEIGSNASVFDSLNALVREGEVEKVRRGEYKWIGG